MDYVNCFRDLFGSKPDCRNLVLIKFSVKKDDDSIHECGFLKNDINCFCEELKNILIQQNEESLN